MFTLQHYFQLIVFRLKTTMIKYTNDYTLILLLSIHWLRLGYPQYTLTTYKRLSDLNHIYTMLI